MHGRNTVGSVGTKSAVLKSLCRFHSRSSTQQLLRDTGATVPIFCGPMVSLCCSVLSVLLILIKLIVSSMFVVSWKQPRTCGRSESMWWDRDGSATGTNEVIWTRLSDWFKADKGALRGQAFWC